MNVRLIPTFLMALLCCSCIKTAPRVRSSDIQNLRATYDEQSSQLRISGLVFHSAWSVKRINERREKLRICLEPILTSSQKCLSGSFEYTLTIPPDVDWVCFGANDQVIWSRSTPRPN